MSPGKIVVLGVKGTVIAFDPATGQRLWAQQLKSGLGDGFVSVLMDAGLVYAHTHGQLYCLDQMTGGILWHDELSGLGYGIASIAVPGTSSSTAILSAVESRRRAEAAAASTAGSTSTDS